MTGEQQRNGYVRLRVSSPPPRKSESTLPLEDSRRHDVFPSTDEKAVVRDHFGNSLLVDVTQ
jgi:hypothetical protein